MVTIAELGAGSGSGYPGALDTDATQESSSTTVRADVPNDFAAAIIAIETELGTDPAGTLTDVKTYLQTEHNTDGTHDNSLVAMLAGAQTVTGNKTFSGTTTLSGATTVSGTLNGSGWPSFVAYLSADQLNITSIDKIEFDTEEFDTNSDYDNATNYRFTPTVAGKYLLTATLNWKLSTTTTGDSVFIYIRKNGSDIAAIQHDVDDGSVAQSMSATTIADANGSSDYFEVFANNSNRDTSDLTGGFINTTFFAGCRIG